MAKIRIKMSEEEMDDAAERLPSKGAQALSRRKAIIDADPNWWESANGDERDALLGFLSDAEDGIEGDPYKLTAKAIAAMRDLGIELWRPSVWKRGSDADFDAMSDAGDAVRDAIAGRVFIGIIPDGGRGTPKFVWRLGWETGPDGKVIDGYGSDYTWSWDTAENLASSGRKPLAVEPEQYSEMIAQCRIPDGCVPFQCPAFSEAPSDGKAGGSR
jgi:hypothetical protein